MKRLSLGWAVAGIVTVLACTLGAMQQQGGVGRYQLIEGRYEIIGKEALASAVTVWRIDTVTGEAVYFASQVGGNAPGSGWVKVRDK
jgi:hypothetical protein